MLPVFTFGHLISPFGLCQACQKLRNFKECCLQVHEEKVEDSTNDPVQLSSSMDSSLFHEVVFHEDNIQVVAINIVEENTFHLSSLFFHDSSIYSASVQKRDPLDVLQEGLNLGDVSFALLGSILLMYS